MSRETKLRQSGIVDRKDDLGQTIVLDTDHLSRDCQQQFRPSACFHVLVLGPEWTIVPRLSDIPGFSLSMKLRPSIFDELLALVLIGTKDEVENIGKDEDDSVCPRFITVVYIHSRVSVVLEVETERLFVRQRDVDVLPKRNPACRFFESTICGGGGDRVKEPR